MADVDTCILDEDDDATQGISIWDGPNMAAPQDQPEDEEDE